MNKIFVWNGREYSDEELKEEVHLSQEKKEGGTLSHSIQMLYSY